MPVYDSTEKRHGYVQKTGSSPSALNRISKVFLVVSLLLIAPATVSGSDMLVARANPDNAVVTYTGQLNNDEKYILQRAESIASQSVLSSSEQDFFNAVSTIPLLSFIKPMSVLGKSSRHRIKKQVVTILENDIHKVQENKSTQLKVGVTQLQSTLQYALQQYNVANKNTSDGQLQEFIDKIAQSRASKELPDGSDARLSLYEAAQIIEQWGIDPHDIEARPYYCALGIRGLNTMDVHSVDFCPKQSAM